jgi:hypothetical protein
MEALAADVLAMLRSADPAGAADLVAPSPRGLQILAEFRTTSRPSVFHARHGKRGDSDLSAALIEPRGWIGRAERSNSEYDGEVVELTAPS